MNFNIKINNIKMVNNILHISNKIKISNLKNKITKIINTNIININNINRSIKSYNKGKLCSIEGKNYEHLIYNLLKNCKLKDKEFYFNTQNINELGGCSSDNDILCNFNKQKDIAIEIKKKNTPDWMQCSIKYDNINNKWYCSENAKIPQKSRDIFIKLINNINLFNGKIPPFLNNPITHSDWVKLKNTNSDFKDVYLDISNDTITKLYKEKGCNYIQISDKGLYYLGNDICNFNVPEFICSQELRIRTKIHKRKNKKGFCQLSVMASCKPKNINKLQNSIYSLDNINKLPNNLIFI